MSKVQLELEKSVEVHVPYLVQVRYALAVALAAVPIHNAISPVQPDTRVVLVPPTTVLWFALGPHCRLVSGPGGAAPEAPAWDAVPHVVGVAQGLGDTAAPAGALDRPRTAGTWDLLSGLMRLLRDLKAQAAVGRGAQGAEEPCADEGDDGNWEAQWDNGKDVVLNTSAW